MSEYAPTTLSLKTHPVPEWFDDAKLGIFIHWACSRSPPSRQDQGEIGDAFLEHYDEAVVDDPLHEWYRNAIRVQGSPSARFHAEHYGDAPYEAFREPFEAGLEQWEPAAWADLFARSGAGYVVLVTKHHDGYCLWPSEIEESGGSPAGAAAATWWGNSQPRARPWAALRRLLLWRHRTGRSTAGLFERWGSSSARSPAAAIPPTPSSDA